MQTLYTGLFFTHALALQLITILFLFITIPYFPTVDFHSCYFETLSKTGRPNVFYCVKLPPNKNVTVTHTNFFYIIFFKASVLSLVAPI